MAEMEDGAPSARKRGTTKGLPWIFDHLQVTRPPAGHQYRESTLGRTLKESIDELIAAGKMTPTLGESILLHFDVHAGAHLERCGIQTKFTTGKMLSFKEISQQYDFVVSDVEFSTRGKVSLNVAVDTVRVIAVPSVKLLKKNALKKSRKGGAYDTDRRQEDKEMLYEVLNDQDEESCEQ